MTNLVPSGRAFATSINPVKPLPAGLLTGTKIRPAGITSLANSMIVRAEVSVPPPGFFGITTSIFLVGYVNCWATAFPMPNVIVSANAASRLFFIKPFLHIFIE